MLKSSEIRIRMRLTFKARNKILNGKIEMAGSKNIVVVKLNKRMVRNVLH